MPYYLIKNKDGEFFSHLSPTFHPRFVNLETDPASMVWMSASENEADLCVKELLGLGVTAYIITLKVG
jgi:hypothetical protein